MEFLGPYPARMGVRQNIRQSSPLSSYPAGRPESGTGTPHGDGRPVDREGGFLLQLPTLVGRSTPAHQHFQPILGKLSRGSNLDDLGISHRKLVGCANATPSVRHLCNPSRTISAVLAKHFGMRILTLHAGPSHRGPLFHLSRGTRLKLPAWDRSCPLLPPTIS